MKRNCCISIELFSVRLGRRRFSALYSAIIKENEASIQLHKKCGFRKIGIREKLAKMKSTGKWHDVVLMERRSSVIGIE